MSFIVAENAPVSVIGPDGSSWEAVTDQYRRFEWEHLRQSPQSPGDRPTAYRFGWKGITLVVSAEYVTQCDGREGVFRPEPRWA